jgi:hypothetical protein
MMALLSLRYGAPSIFFRILSTALTTLSGLIFGGFFVWVAVKRCAGLDHLPAAPGRHSSRADRLFRFVYGDGFVAALL